MIKDDTKALKLGLKWWINGARQLGFKIFDTISDIYLTTQCNMDAFKGKYERTSADQYDEFMKVHI